MRVARIVIAAVVGLVLVPVSASSAAPVRERATVEVFYTDSSGACWAGLAIDRAGNLYPVQRGNVAMVSAEGSLLNDGNFATSFSNGNWAAIDDRAGKLYVTSGTDEGFLFSGPIVEGTELTAFGPGGDSAGVAIGRGRLNGDVFVVDQRGTFPAGRIMRLDPATGALTLFASPGFLRPDAIAISANGVVYTVDLGTEPAQIVRTMPDGTSTTFATGPPREPDAFLWLTRGLAVDNSGKVYWSRADGVGVYSKQGKLLYVLPGPPDQERFINPMGMQIDKTGRYLYVVDNGACRKIYRYTLH